MKTLKIFVLLVLISMVAHAQQYDINNTQLPEVQRNNIRHTISIPDILGYKTLKCDFHMHTVFSDGSVWPTIRVEEAWKEGLDVISITDHIERQPSKKFIGGDKNSSYELAKNLAEEMDIILIPGGEVSRSMPPGHLNAIFLSDINMLDKEDWRDALKNAKDDGGFIMWNHPGWRAQQPDTCLWMSEHEELYRNKMIHGIEIFNEKEWYPIALDWCIEKNLTPIANSDIHGVAEYYYDYSNFLRPMTLVFAKDRSQASVKEALFAGRAVAFFANVLAGKPEYLKAIFTEAVSVKKAGKMRNNTSNRFEITNNSDIPFNIEGAFQIELKPHSTVSVGVKLDKNDIIKVTNLVTSSKSCLELSFSEI
ncbi:MAG: hypothetical protein Q4G63_12515 [Bacteroidia bacterium]|nr:hypothetical protein [Bacteroidia bacterium]